MKGSDDHTNTEQMGVYAIQMAVKIAGKKEIQSLLLLIQRRPSGMGC